MVLDADERTGRRQALRKGVDRGHHGADTVRLSRRHDSHERELVLSDGVFSEGRRLAVGPRRDFIAGHERRRRRAVVERRARVRRSPRRHPIAVSWFTHRTSG